MADTRPTETLTLAGAQRVLTAALARADELGVAVVVTVVDPAGHPIASARMDGAPLLSIGVAADKAWTVVSFGLPTDWWAEAMAIEPGLSALASGRPLMPVPGGVPIKQGGGLLGAVGVSGASSEQDREVAEAGASAIGAGRDR
jgi:uncharacterized protein GlcG (DUF336 family)